jgi:nucleoside triphosphate diphosphatase
MDPSRDIGRLLEIMAALRTPETGCPWDLAQNFSTIAPYTLEEAYEVADAIARDDLTDLKDELGDLLLQVVFHARMAEERGAFDFGDGGQAITEKLIRRHPHVFADETSRTPRAVAGLWERIKAEENAANKTSQAGALAGIPVALPALSRALKLQVKASKVGRPAAKPRNRQAWPRWTRFGMKRRLPNEPGDQRPCVTAGGTENLALSLAALSGSARTVMAITPFSSIDLLRTSVWR